MTSAGGAVLRGGVADAEDAAGSLEEATPLNSIDSTLRAITSRIPAEAGRPDASRTGTAPLLAADGAATPGDPLGRGPGAALLAELVLHERVETPFCIGLLGPSGVGKSVFLDQVLAAADRVASAAAGAGLATPFVTDIAVVRVDAAAAAGQEPETLLWSAMAERLAETHPVLAEELDRAGTDPHATLQTANGRMDDARKALETERRTLEELGSRDARLVDTVLDTPGSLIDRYARAKRSGLERVQRQFGFGGDPVATFKGLVHETSDRSGTLSRVGLSLRALYAFPGQRRLVVGVLILVAVAWGCALARSDQAGWIDGLRGLGEKAGPVADWLAAHLSWLGTLEAAAELLAVALLLLDVVRAARFVLPISRGIDLLHQDLEVRRRELASLIAHQTRRVDTLAAEAEGFARRAAEAETRAVAQDAARMGVPRTARPDAHGSRAATVFQALRTAMAGPAGAGRRPRRIVVALDGLDQRPPEAAAALVAAARRLLGPGVVTLLCADRDHLLAGFGEADPAGAHAALARCIQVPYRMEAADADTARSYATRLIDGAGGGEVTASAPDPHLSLLDEPWRDREADTVTALAPFAGSTPRAIKRFVNLYRIARADPRLRGAGLPAATVLALALALDRLAGPEDLAGLEQAIRGETPTAPSLLLREALAAASAASRTELALGPRGLAVAARYSSRASV